MGALFEVLRQRENLPTKALSAIIVVAAAGFALHQSAQRASEMPEIVAQAVTSKDPDSVVPSLGSDFMADSPAENASAEHPLGNDVAPRMVLDAVAPTPASGDASSNAMVTEPKHPAVINQGIAPFILPNLFSNPAAGTSNSEAAFNPGAGQKTTPKSVSAAQRAKEIAAIQRAKLIEDRQEWEYCLAPSYAEHKMYLSTPIPSSAISDSADVTFDRTLKKNNIAHDEVQCPRAPNRPTLLFRRRYAIRWNQENGNTIVTFKWQPDVERADEDLTSSQPLVMSSSIH
jgi:hypothetical protein